MTAILACLLLALAITPSPEAGLPTAPSDKNKEKTSPVDGLVERGEYEQAIAHYADRLSRPETTVRDALRIRHALGYLYLFADRLREASRNSRTALSLAGSSGLSGEASSFRIELAIQEAYGQAMELRQSGDIAASNRKFEEAYRLAGRIDSAPYRLKIVSAWSINYAGGIAGEYDRFLALSDEALNLALSLNYMLEAMSIGV